VDPTANNNDAVRKAAENGHVEVVWALLKWKGPSEVWVDPTANDNKAVQKAAKTAMPRWCVHCSTGWDRVKNGWTPLSETT
jgi:hypothetical protein